MFVIARSMLWLLVWGCLGCGQKQPASAPADVRQPTSKAVLRFGSPSEALESAPISLTGSDGSGLVLVSVDARTVLEDPLAFTELHLTFHNPEARRREGRFAITLPDNAAISRFAMRVGAEFQEGEVVERKRAQQVYDEFLQRRQDPALLEKAAGNQFTARVFPIEANANKEIIVSYSEELTARGDPYRLRLAGLPRIAELKVDVLLGSSSDNGLESSLRARGPESRLTLTERNYAPRADLEVKLPARKAFALRSGNLVVARVAPAPAVASEALSGLTVLFDTSASRALGFAAQVERLAGLLTELARREPGLAVRIIAFDQSSEEVFHGAAQDFTLRDKARLIERDAFGASNLERVLSELAASRQVSRRVLLVGDGVITAGTEDMTLLREAVAKLAAHGAERLDVLAEGGIQDAETLRALSQAGLKSSGVVLDAHTSFAAMADRMLAGTVARVTVEVANATFTYPASFEGVQAGEERLIFAEVPEGSPVQIALGGAQANDLPTLEVPRALLRRAWARAKLAVLTAELRALPSAASDERSAREAEIVELSRTERVVSDYTALLVLETDEDYRRFDIAQDALTSILSVGPEGLIVRDRTPSDGKGSRMARDDAVEAPRDPPVAVQASNRSRSEEQVQDRGAPEKSRPADAPDSREAAPVALPAAPPAPTPAGSRAVAESESDDERKDSSAARSDVSLGGLGLQGTGGGGGGASEGSRVVQPRLHSRVTSVAGLTLADVERPVRNAAGRMRSCYRAAEGAHDTLAVALQIAETGRVADASVTRGSLGDAQADACVLTVFRGLRFPKPESARASLAVSCDFVMEEVAVASTPVVAAARPRPPVQRAHIATPSIEDAYSGELASVMRALAAHDLAAATTIATAAHTRDPGDVLALIALGETLEARLADMPEKTAPEAALVSARAARVYGSLIDLFPGRPDLRRLAGERLERLADAGRELAIDSYEKARAQRPDHPSGHRLLAFAQLKSGAYQAAFATLERALARGFPGARFPEVARILREDLALVAAAWSRAEPAAEARIKKALDALGVSPAREPSLRFVLNWETDANDVDFHIYDGRNGHAFYQSPRLASGGSLYADVTTGYGPECFAVSGRAQAYPYVLQAHYFARGPMGYGMGKLEIVQHDGRGVLAFQEHPFVIMKDKAFVELARLSGPL